MLTPSREPSRTWLMPTSCVLLATVCLPLLATAAMSGKSSAEKMLTNMIQPLFLAIVVALMIGVALLRRNERRVGWLLVCGASLMWVLSSSIFASFLVESWESSIESSVPTVSEPFDYVIVLGGGRVSRQMDALSSDNRAIVLVMRQDFMDSQSFSARSRGARPIANDLQRMDRYAD